MKIRYAIIGCGAVAVHHAAQMARTGTLVAVCDISAGKAEALAAPYRAKVYPSADELLMGEPDVQVVGICTPNGLHAEHAIKSLQAGKHVLCETPLCLTGAAAWQLVETEKFCRRRLLVVSLNRFNPVLQAVKDLMAAQALGTIRGFKMGCQLSVADAYFNSWRGRAFPGGGTLYAAFSDAVDTLAWLLGPVETVTASTAQLSQPASEVEASGEATLQMQQGTVGTLHWDIGTDARAADNYLVLSGAEGTIHLGGAQLQEVRSWGARVPAPGNGDGRQDHLYHLFYDRLGQALESRVPHFASIFDGLRTVETIEKIYKSVAPTLPA